MKYVHLIMFVYIAFIRPWKQINLKKFIIQSPKGSVAVNRSAIITMFAED